MSIHNKLILPMISDKLTLDDILPDKGFAGIYTLDINKPFLTDHVFLLYEFKATKASKDTKNKLASLPNLYNKRTVSINNTLYTLFCFTINTPIKYIKKGTLSMLTKQDKIQISKFWNTIDDDINEYLFGSHIVSKKFEDSVVPEEDFSPKEFITYDEKRGGLVMSLPL